MNEAASKRLRLRFFAEDERAVDEALALTTHSSKSNVIRAALAFYETVWASLREGFRVVYSRDGETADADVMAAAKPDKAEKGPRNRTETSIEIRITPADYQRIEGLIAREAADTASEAVRRSVRLYAATAARSRDGFDVLAISPSGDLLHVPVPGLTVPKRERTAPRPAHVAAPDAAFRPRSLDDLLPRSLSGIVAELAEKENCPPDLLLIDIIRSETLARLHGFKQAMPQPASQPALEPAPQPPAAIQAPQPDPRDEKLLQDIAAAFNDIDSQVESLMRLFGETARSDGQQELSDLLFAAGLVDDGSAAAIAEDTAATFSPACADAASPELARLLTRARDLNERLVALASIAAMSPRKKSRAKKADAALQACDLPETAPRENAI